jgi:aspartate carbamoyltransferase regulatory subunit
MKRTLEVAAIKEGTVIDHIPGDKVLKMLAALNINNNHQITIGVNLESKKQKKKGIIKIAGRKMTETELNKIAVLAPDATINTIIDYEVTKKKNVELFGIEPDTIQCNNPNCITNHEQVQRKFRILEKEPLKILCHFCERTIEKEEIQFI